MISRKDKLWMSIMDFFAKYGGCHQIPERSFFFGGYQFPLCARCTGIAIGYIVGTLAFIFKIRLSYVTFVVIMLPCAVDGVLQLCTKYVSNNRRRFFTGILCGAAISEIVLQSIAYIFNCIF